MKKAFLAVVTAFAVLLSAMTHRAIAADNDFSKKFNELYNQLKSSELSIAESDHQKFTDFYNQQAEAQKSHFQYYYDSIQAWITIKSAVINLKKANDVLKSATGSALKPALENFVAAYNGFKDLQIELTRLGTGGDDFGGLLIGDPTLIEIEKQLRNSLITPFVPNTLNSLSQLGITLAAKSKYDVDKKKLSDAVNKDAKQIPSFLKGDGQSTGIVTKMGLAVDNALKKDGLINNAIRALNDEVQAM